MSNKDITKQHVPFTEVSIKRHEPPEITLRKDKNNNLYTVYYHYQVFFQYSGSTLKINCEDINQVFEAIKENQTVYSPTWEEVTDNGRYSCD